MPGEVKPSAPGDVVAGQVPNWMNDAFFQKALREGGDDPKVSVTRCEVTEATGKGENYVSIVYRALVEDGNGKKHHLIVKCLPSNEARKMLSNKAKFFRKEADMYGIVLPAYEEIHGEAGSSLPWPKHYFSVLNGDNDYLVMEDLKVAGYVMRERLKGLDPNHLEVAMSALARFHAYSYALKVRDPEAFQRKVIDLFPETMFHGDFKEMMDIFIDQAYKNTAAAIREWGGSKYERIADKMEKMVDTIFDDVSRVIEPVEPGAVLNHGDFWVNNMLFRYASKKEAETGSGKPLDIKLLDFQISRYSSPAADLMYLFASSATADTRKEHWNRLLEHAYLESFWSTLESLGHKGDVKDGVFSLEWLQAEIKRLRPFALLSSVTVTQAVLAEVGEAPDMDELTEDELNGTAESPFAELAKGKTYQERLKGLLEDFDEWGLFD